MSIRDRLNELVDIVDEEEEFIDEEELEEEEIIEEDEKIITSEAETSTPSAPQDAVIPPEEMEQLLNFLSKKNKIVAEFAQVSLQYENAKESLLSLLKISENEIKSEISRIRELCDLPAEVRYSLTLPTQQDPVGRFTKADD